MTLSTPMKRLFANILDGIIMFIVFFILIGIAGNSESGFLILIAFIVPSIIQGYFWSKGTTIGKNMFKMKVINKDTQITIGFWIMFIRETIGKYISGFVFSLGYIWILIDSENQAWHDKLINSVVVDIEPEYAYNK